MWQLMVNNLGGSGFSIRPPHRMLAVIVLIGWLCLLEIKSGATVFEAGSGFGWEVGLVEMPKCFFF
jgi:hypothetical protein